MNNFLLEIYGEEIPSWAQKIGENELVKLFQKFLDENEINYKTLESYSSSRRIILLASNVVRYVNENNIEIRGPSIEADENALQGFLKKNNSSKDELVQKIVKNKEYYFITKKSSPKKVHFLLEQAIPSILKNIKWKKSMRWNEFDDKWIRPIKNIMCIFEDKKINFKFGGTKSNDFTYGNYHYKENKIKITRIKDHKKILQKNYVEISRTKRKAIIMKKINNFCTKENLKIVENSQLFDRVSDTVEYPNVFFATYSKKYFDLPEFVIKSVMFDKQDYFCFEDKGKLSNRFAFVSSKQNTEKKNIVKGNENVLKARFSDAKFFIDEDLKKKLSDRLPDLKNIIFFKNAGTLYQRSFRIKSIVNFISQKIDFDATLFEKYLILSNVDLTCELVKEFPNLQGKVGGYYASKENFPDEISDAFFSQYNLTFEKQHNNILSHVLSISQKIDSIIGFFVSYKKISGAGDPFGVRRSTLSIIKICIEKKIDLDLIKLLEFSFDEYIKQNLKIDIDLKIISDFFKKRIGVLFVEIGYKSELVDMMLSKDKINPFKLSKEIEILNTFINSNHGVNFLKAIKRMISINDARVSSLNPDPKKFKLKEENLLFECVEKLVNFRNGINFIQDKEFIISFTQKLNTFFDNVKVNVDDSLIQNNRKALIRLLCTIIEKFYKFSLIKF